MLMLEASDRSLTTPLHTDCTKSLHWVRWASAAGERGC